MTGTEDANPQSQVTELGPAVPEATPEDAPPEVETPGIVEEDREPGGTDPTAVYARKQRQERNRMARQAAIDREARIRAEERLRVVETTRAQPTQEKIYTAQEVQRAVDAGAVTPAEATAYLTKVTMEQTYRKLEMDRQQWETQQRVENEAQQEINRYLSVAPYLADDTDPKTLQVVDVYNQLRYKFNLPDNLVTKAMAVKQSLGPVSNLQKRKASDNLTRDGANLHTSRSGGGGADTAIGDEALVSKAPAHIKEAWDRYGTSPKDRVTEIKIYNKTHAKK